MLYTNKTATLEIFFFCLGTTDNTLAQWNLGGRPLLTEHLSVKFYLEDPSTLKVKVQSESFKWNQISTLTTDEQTTQKPQMHTAFLSISLSVGMSCPQAVITKTCYLTHQCVSLHAFMYDFMLSLNWTMWYFYLKQKHKTQTYTSNSYVKSMPM